jgi:hypothetical protein
MEAGALARKIRNRQAILTHAIFFHFQVYTALSKML